jgi:pentapeptide MXKDX repeat protein
MKKISYVLAAVATIAVGAPAFARDKMGDDGMKKPMMKHHHTMKKHMMHKKMMMKKAACKTDGPLTGVRRRQDYLLFMKRWVSENVAPRRRRTVLQTEPSPPSGRALHALPGGVVLS